jgi:hypothetical protein
MSLSIQLVCNLSHEARLKKIASKEFANINIILSKNNLPCHIELEIKSKQETWWPEINCPYSAIHQLKYVAAKFIEDPFWNPDLLSAKKYKIPVNLNKKIYEEKSSQLICHSDFDGFYVPIDFDNAIYDRETNEWLGSSFGLRRELDKLAQNLNFSLHISNNVTTEQMFSLLEEKLKNDPFKIHKKILFCLYYIADFSIKWGSVIFLG